CLGCPRLERGNGRGKLGELFAIGARQRREQLGRRHTERCFRRAKHAAAHGTRPIRCAESPREPTTDAAVPESITNSGLPPLANSRRNELHVERVADCSESQRAEYRREKPRDRRSILVDRSLSEKHEGDGKPTRRTERGGTKHPMTERLLSFARECLALGALAPGNLDRGAQIGERQSRAELPASLIDVEPDDRQQRRQRGCDENHDIANAASRIAGQQREQVPGREHSEPNRPGCEWHDERISRPEPGSQRGWKSGPYLRRGRECHC